MIKFFRHIRKSLLHEGKTTKYFKYAIGEIALVMIGILLALQVNNWNQNRIDNIKEQNYLLGIETDLKAQIATMESIEKFYDTIIFSAGSILTDFQNLKSIKEIPNLNKRIVFLMYENNFVELNTSFTELISTGNIGLINNKDLRKHIVQFYQYSAWTNNSVEQNIKNVFYKTTFPIITEIAIINPSDFNIKVSGVAQNNVPESLVKEQTRLLKNSAIQKKLINAINLKILTTTTNKNSVNNIIKEGKRLLEEIQKELSLQ